MLETINGWPVKYLSQVVVVSSKEAAALRRKDLEADKSRRKHNFAPYVNPDTYTEEERKFMES